jgi:hypothetical protein
VKRDTRVILLIKAFPLLAILVFLVSLISPRSCALVSGSRQAAVAALRACPRARALLGDGIHVSTFGCTGGQSRAGCTAGEAHLGIPVTGSRQRGHFRFAVAMEDGRWSDHVVGRLTVGEQALQVPSHCRDDSDGAATRGACKRLKRCCADARGRGAVSAICSTRSYAEKLLQRDPICEQLRVAAVAMLRHGNAVVPRSCYGPASGRGLR